MIKILCLAVLLALTCQLQLASHEQAQPFTGNKFIITQNAFNDKSIAGTKINFTNSFVLNFKSQCGGSNAPFTTRLGNTFTVSKTWSTVPTPASCVTTDGKIKKLFNNAVKYQEVGKNVRLLDSKNVIALTLAPY